MKEYVGSAIRNGEAKTFERIIEKAESIAKRNEDIRSRVGRISDSISPAMNERSDAIKRSSANPGYGGIVGKLYDLLEMMESSQDSTNESLSNLEKAV